MISLKTDKGHVREIATETHMKPGFLAWDRIKKRIAFEIGTATLLIRRSRIDTLRRDNVSPGNQRRESAVIHEERRDRARSRASTR